MSSTTTEAGTPRVSAYLAAMIEKFADAHYSTKQLADQILLQARQEGLTAQNTRELITSALKRRQLSDRAIRAYLPTELKNAVKAAARARPNKYRQSTEDILSTRKLVGQAEHDPQPEQQSSAADPDTAAANSEFGSVTEAELYKRNKELEQQVDQLQHGIDQLGAGITTAAEIVKATTYNVLIGPYIYSRLFAAIKKNPAAIILRVQGSGPDSQGKVIDFICTDSQGAYPANCAV